MNYDLALKLKDAGFPQEIKHGSHFYYDSIPNSFVIANIRERALDEPTTRIPTLSELIEACGDNIDYLTKRFGTSYWYAGKKKSSEEIIEGGGETPEIAVANLYLALHGKQ